MQDDGKAETPDDEVPPDPAEAFDHTSEMDLRLRELDDLEEGYVDLDAIPLPRRADRMEPKRKRDLQYFGFGCGLLIVSLMALTYALWGVVQAVR